MSANFGAIVNSTVAALGYELVDVERSSRGLLRVFIDKPGGIAVEDCVAVSNHLTRVFAVEAVDFDRLEVSSPGLDRPLKHLDDFRRFSGRSAKIKLNVTIDGRKRFDGVIDAVDGGVIVFRIAEEIAKPGAAPRKPVKSVATMARKGLPAPTGVGQPAIRVPLESIDRARLIPEI